MKNIERLLKQTHSIDLKYIESSEYKLIIQQTPNNTDNECWTEIYSKKTYICLKTNQCVFDIQDLSDNGIILGVVLQKSKTYNEYDLFQNLVIFDTISNKILKYIDLSYTLVYKFSDSIEIIKKFSQNRLSKFEYLALSNFAEYRSENPRIIPTLKRVVRIQKHSLKYGMQIWRMISTKQPIVLKDTVRLITPPDWVHLYNINELYLAGKKFKNCLKTEKFDKGWHYLANYKNGLVIKIDDNFTLLQAKKSMNDGCSFDEFTTIFKTIDSVKNLNMPYKNKMENKE